MLNDKNIGRAIAQAAEKTPGKKAGIARALRISPSTLGRIEDGNTGEIEHKQWMLLYPILSPFLPKAADGLPLLRYRPASELDKINLSITTSGQCHRCHDVSDAALSIALRWYRLCPEQQGRILERIVVFEEDDAGKKDRNFASSKIKGA